MPLPTSEMIAHYNGGGAVPTVDAADLRAALEVLARVKVKMAEALPDVQGLSFVVDPFEAVCSRSADVFAVILRGIALDAVRSASDDEDIPALIDGFAKMPVTVFDLQDPIDLRVRALAAAAGRG